MWDENKVLELLKDMPQTLSDENLCAIQKLIDDNKYWNSLKLKKDLCGIYAPFCKICDKTVLTPCAVAYVRMKVAEGMELEMENVTSEIEHPEALLEVMPTVEETVEEEVVEEVVVEEPIEEEIVEEQPVESKKIRIGIGYRKF